MVRKRKIPAALLIIVTLLAIALILQYGINVKYKFSPHQKFTGGKLYNPYQRIDTAIWQVSNFHAHTHKIPDFKHETLNHTKYVDSLYRYLGYDIIGISDYQMINEFEKNHRWYVPAYEHGYQYYKNHHLVLNAQKVSWLDYLFKQTLDNKQYVINQLKKDEGIILTLVHPILRHALSFDDLKYLGNYNCLEVLDNKYQFLAYYDAVLSSGHHVFLMADDDSHNQRNQVECGSCFNMINTPLLKDSILYSLKTGKAYAVKMNLDLYSTNESKKEAIRWLPELVSFKVNSDTITAVFSRKVKTIKFIGQEGSEVMSFSDVYEASVFFRPEDTYIRTEVECYDGTLFYLNPVFRYDGILKTDPSPPVDIMKTRVYRVVFAVIFLIAVATLIYKRKNV